ncbi:MAG: tRNA uridine-5-carboxymethylaminomethyl(34) synthesis enzyme MnmG [Actinobacteria bacterium]|nr:tRNA uridine-5-carboxymethylaminomethyl(34) synthesis enzyme MnmG [Actinomycetota bacterium]
MSQSSTYDVIIIGGGHAGIEAALAAARLSASCALVTTNSDHIGLMPCNPSIGGPAKGQIVGEIDALGGEMGHAADQTHIQLKILNRSRGPAVQCLRAQNDKWEYQAHMNQVIHQHPNITVITDTAQDLIIENNQVKGAICQTQTLYAHSVVITTGTFLKGRLHTGLTNKEGGRDSEPNTTHLSDCLAKHFKLGRLKTGTPPRLDRDSIDFGPMDLQPGDTEFLRFSFRSAPNQRYLNQIDCYSTYTSLKSHDIILNNLDRSPLYTNVIQGTGPRYCPSIEDKVVRFKDKPRHQIFIEPEGRNTNSIYPQGLNTSLPEDVQLAFMKQMPGLENVKVLKYGYAVEYDFIYPNQLKRNLESIAIKNLFFAGQINGTSGYEEAAGQGLIAGINGALNAQNRAPFILTRQNSFIGTMIDDLITKPIYEPYRMLTSRSEYRLLLRQDNASQRLSEAAFEIGLLSVSQIQQLRNTHDEINAHQKRWKKHRTDRALNEKFNLSQPTPLINILKRPEAQISTLLEHQLISPDETESAQRALVEIKYEGYIEKQKKEITKINALDSLVIPKTLDFNKIKGLKEESRSKFITYRPHSIGDAKKVAGINPADIMVLITYLKKCQLTPAFSSPQHQ